MEDPGKHIVGQLMPKPLTHAQQMKEAQRLLRLAIEQREDAREKLFAVASENNYNIFTLAQVHRHWSFFLLPSWLRRQIVRSL